LRRALNKVEQVAYLDDVGRVGLGEGEGREEKKKKK
jgi:hypothetical protein